MITLILILYFSIETADNVNRMKSNYVDLVNNVKDIHDYMLYDLKPRTIIIDRVLSYQLPTAIVRAFEISHTDLRETLEGVVVDLAKLTEVYRALLGFNSDWGLEENAQRLKCSWEAKTIKEEKEDGSQELNEHLLRVNTSIEQVRSMYGDFAGVKLEIESLFDKIRTYIVSNLNDSTNSTLIQLDYFMTNATKELNQSLMDMQKNLISNFTKLVSSNFKLRNLLIDMNIQRSIDRYVTDTSRDITNNRYRINATDYHLDEIGDQSSKLLNELRKDTLFLTRYHKRLGKLVEYTINNNLLIKPYQVNLRSNENRRSNTAEKKSRKGKKKRHSMESDEHESKKRKYGRDDKKTTFKDLKSVYTSREQAFNIEILNQNQRYNPLSAIISNNRSALKEHYRRLTHEFGKFNNGTDLGLFYSLSTRGRYSSIKGSANKKLSRMRRFTFIPHLTAYQLPLSRMSVRIKGKPQRTLIKQTEKDDGKILNEFAAKTRSLLKYGHYWDTDLDPLGLCYIGNIPGYKLVHCPTSMKDN